MNQEEHNINFKTSVLRSSLCDYSDACILVKWNIAVNNTAAEGSAVNNTNKKIIFITCAPFTDCISKKILRQIMLNILI